MSATECALRYCINSYKPRVRDGRLEELELPISFERVPESWQPHFHDHRLLEVVQADFDNSLARLNERECYMILRSDLQLRLLDENVQLSNDVQQAFNITQKSISTIIASMDDVMVSSIEKALSNSTNFTASIELAASSLSYRMHKIDSTTLGGTARHSVVHIQVRWAFPTLPVFISVAGLCLL